MNKVMIFPAVVLLGFANNVFAANSAVTTVSATINTATCDVTVNPSTVTIAANNGSALLDKDKILTGHQNLTLSVTCNGVFATGGQSKVAITGTANNPTGGSAEAKKLYRDAGSTSTGFGVAVANKSGAADAAWTDIVSGDISFALNNTTQTKSLQVALACGTTSDCTIDKLKAGSLSAAITFTHKQQ